MDRGAKNDARSAPHGARRLLRTAALAALALVGATPALAQAPAAPAGPVPMAVLGDSDSHAYQDSISFPPGSGDRGGPYRPRTFQWTEVLARLRAGVIDPGPWEINGQNRLVAALGELADLPGVRSPRKQDYRFNVATSGAGCEALTDGPHRQVQPLLQRMAQGDKARWRQGVVVIRIGLINMTQPGFLDALSRDPAAPAQQKVMTTCLSHVTRAVEMIRAAFPQTHIVLVGVFNEANDPLQFGSFQSRTAMDNIDRGLDRYDGGLRELAARTPHASFFDDRAWFRSVWGQRGADGRPAYRDLKIGDRLTVTLSVGNEPTHGLTGDDHWGLAANAKWAQAMSRHLASAGLPVRPIEDAEVQRFVEAQLR